jgi:hypothetical protein
VLISVQIVWLANFPSTKNIKFCKMQVWKSLDT